MKKENNSIRFTVLTPTYNRADKLLILYKSLCAQSYRNFEWVVVADGSEDNTDEVMKKFQSEKKITIKYIWQENGGKHRAHNAGVAMADSDLVMICDDDDHLADDSLNRAAEYWQAYVSSEIGGMIGLRGEDDQHPLCGKKFPNRRTGHLIDIFPKDHFFDTVQIYRTELLKKTLFPEVAGEKFVPEVVCWREIDQDYRLIIVPEVLEIAKYLPGGLTMSGRYTPWNNPGGYAYYFRQKQEIEHGIKAMIYCGMANGLLQASGQNTPLKIASCNPLSLVVSIYARWRCFRKETK